MTINTSLFWRYFHSALALIKRYPMLSATLLLIIIFIPWLGLSPFNTKGEPREAIVAYSMLESGNWILPVSLGGDIPYKPPFLAWCIAAVSLLTGGVTEFTARLPSAIAVIVLCVISMVMVKRHGGGVRRGVVTALILATCTEVWRAGAACRVDMVLTACMVGAIYLLFNYTRHGCKRYPWWAIVCMTAAVLTKGPVGMILPILIALVYGLIIGIEPHRLILRLEIAAILTLIIPAVWYVAAYHQGGQEFLDLALEENFGRFMGKMSYESHVNPVWYNFATLAAGLLPYTLLVLLGVFAIKLRKPHFRFSWKAFLNHVRAMDSWKLYSLIAAVIIFVFYCIPKSKRSVYLLPMYPFVAYGIALTVIALRHKFPVRIFARIMASLAIIVPVALWGFTAFGPDPQTLSDSPRFIAEAIAIASTSLSGIICLGITMYIGATAWQLSWNRPANLISLFAPIMALFITFSAAVLPPILSDKSDRPIAETIAHTASNGPVYQYLTAPMLRFYTINFYLNDRLRSFEHELPERGWLILGADDIEEWRRAYGDTYRTIPVKNFDHKSCDTGQRPMLIRFTRR